MSHISHKGYLYAPSGTLEDKVHEVPHATRRVMMPCASASATARASSATPRDVTWHKFGIWAGMGKGNEGKFFTFFLKVTYQNVSFFGGER